MNAIHATCIVWQCGVCDKLYRDQVEAKECCRCSADGCKLVIDLSQSFRLCKRHNTLQKLRAIGATKRHYKSEVDRCRLRVAECEEEIAQLTNDYAEGKPKRKKR